MNHYPLEIHDEDQRTASWGANSGRSKTGRSKTRIVYARERGPNKRGVGSGYGARLARSLPDYDQTAGAQSQAAVAAKDALFASL
ncbi:MAG: hypothetical protein B7Z73_03905 [Planctomycetia bacterium 21-64-5]|nr:MAG: hypothetical protein B7Z73_03905 [Planctomycetia bacterium 21-64-5]